MAGRVMHHEYGRGFAAPTHKARQRGAGGSEGGAGGGAGGADGGQAGGEAT
jgi:hypothetical protein